MHWEECTINSNKETIEMNLSSEFIIEMSKHLVESMISSTENSKNCSYRKYVMEMCNYVISIMESDI